MPTTENLIALMLVALGLVLTPGPNMIYLISRSLCQGPRAGLVSLIGTMLGFVFYMLAATLGLTALIFAIPIAYDAIRYAGAAYLLWMAWDAVRPGGRSPFETRDLPPVSDLKLFSMGLMTNLLNPKVALFYMSLLPQFVDATRPLMSQLVVLGMAQISVSMLFNTLFILLAGQIAVFLSGRPRVQLVQRWLMGTVLSALALRMVLDRR